MIIFQSLHYLNILEHCEFVPECINGLDNKFMPRLGLGAVWLTHIVFRRRNEIYTGMVGIVC